MIFAITLLAIFGGAMALVLVKMHREATMPLFCGECGKFTTDLTDDDVCFVCNATLSRHATRNTPEQR